jgi:hypothetical protein
MDHDIKYLTVKELAERWRLEAPTLAMWRCRKKGPQYHKMSGRILYSLQDVLSYENENMISSEKCG